MIKIQMQNIIIEEYCEKMRENSVLLYRINRKILGLVVPQKRVIFTNWIKIKKIKDNKRDQQWIGPSGKELGPFKHLVRGSIPGSCVWKKFGWEERTHFVCPTGSPTEISYC